MQGIIYCSIVLRNYNIMEPTLPSASESGLGEVDNSAICVGVGTIAKKKENHKASTQVKIVIKSQNMVNAMDQIKHQDVSKVNKQPSGSQKGDDF